MKRPALVIARAGQSDYILCQITSKGHHSGSTPIEEQVLKTGNLKRASYIRHDVLFTASERVIDRQVAMLTQAKMIAIFEKIIVIVNDAIQYRQENEGR
jgi:hypothetical protein